MAVQNYIDLIIPQHRSQPKFVAWLTAKLNMLYNIENLMNSINPAYDLDNAVGAQLDVQGQILGVSRVLPFQPTSGASPVLTDYYYRLVLKAKIMKNQWDGTRGTYDEMLSTLFAGYPIIIVDNCNMSVGIAYLLSSTDTLISDLLTHGYLFPTAAGIATTLVSVAPGEWGNLYYRNFKWGDLTGYTWSQLNIGI